jgi:hypothetical protein
MHRMKPIREDSAKTLHNTDPCWYGDIAKLTQGSLGDVADGMSGMFIFETVSSTGRLRYLPGDALLNLAPRGPCCVANC